MAMNKVRGLVNVATYALFSILCLVLNREAAQNFGRPDKARRALLLKNKRLKLSIKKSLRVFRYEFLVRLFLSGSFQIGCVLCLEG